MKKYLFVTIATACTLLCSAPRVQAQILLEFDTVYSGITFGEVEMIGHNNFTNILPQLKTFRWVRNVVTITPGWTTAICDVNTCYTPGVDSMEVELGPGASSLLDVHLRLNGIYSGYALVELLVKDVNNPVSHVTAVYIFDSSITGTQAPEPLRLNVYPNPSNGLFRVEEAGVQAAVLEVYSLAGSLLGRFEPQGNDRFDLTRLPAGTYHVKLTDERGVLLGTKVISRF